MRGKAIDIGPIHGELGITPAYAGKSCRPEAAVPDLRDHPRVCGEKGLNPVLAAYNGGSPPRMRGKDQYYLGADLSKGITPAYAGKSSGHMQRFGTSGDHPRVCGEKNRSLDRAQETMGSPPRMRGKVNPFV